MRSNPGKIPQAPEVDRSWWEEKGKKDWQGAGHQDHPFFLVATVGRSPGPFLLPGGHRGPFGQSLFSVTKADSFRSGIGLSLYLLEISHAALLLDLEAQQPGREGREASVWGCLHCYPPAG